VSVVRATAPARTVGELDADVQVGPLLLAAVDDGPGLRAHRDARGGLREVDLAELERTANRIDLRGRGGAGFPFAHKLRTLPRRSRTPVVVNVCEGEPMSAKDSTLAVLADGPSTEVAHRAPGECERPPRRR
jgi:hypothetical protein